MQEHLIELSVGEILHVGEYTVKIVAIEGEDLCFEILDDGQNDAGELIREQEEDLVAV